MPSSPGPPRSIGAGTADATPPRDGLPAPGLHVMHVVATADGAPWMYEQLRELRTRGHRVSAVVASADGTLAPKLAAAGIAYHVLDLNVLRTRNPATAAARLVALVRLLRRVRPDVVQYHLFPSVILGRLAAWLADVPVRCSMIASPYHLEVPGLDAIDARTAWLDTKVIASCEWTRTLYARHGVPADRVDLMYYGPDARLFDPARADGPRVRRELGLAPATPTVGMVAWFYPPHRNRAFTPPHLIDRAIKGHDVLLRAVPRILARVPDVVFLLVGDGWGPNGAAYRAEIEALARDLGVSHAVRFTGVRADIPDTLAACDVSVQCSLHENLGGSLESLLMARPFVATAVGGLVDSVRHEQTGLLVAPDRPDALADAILRLLDDRPLAARLAAQGRAFALERFTLTTTADALDRLYRTQAGLTTGEPDARRRVTGRRRSGYRLHRTIGRMLILSAWIWSLPARLLIARWRRPASPVDAAGAAAPVRVLHVAAAQHAPWLVSICQQLRARGYDARAVIGAPDGDLATRLRDAGVPYLSLPLAFAPRLRRWRLLAAVVHLPVTVWRLARLFRRERVEIVHTHIFASIFIGRLAAWLARVPHRVAMVPGPLHLEAPLTRWADRLTWWMDHRVVAGSEWTGARYRALGLRAPRLECIGYGTDAERFDPARADPARVRRELGIAAGAPLIGLVAWFYPPRTDWQTPPFMRGRGLKGHEDLLAAARIIRRQVPDARILLAGGGSNAKGDAYRQRLVAQCRDDAVLAEAVIFTGPRDDVADVLASLDVAVQCSLSENYGGTIEALLMERPTVATRVGGMPETVRHGETGLLVPPGDPEALAAAILRLLADREAAIAMARAGRRLMLARFQIARTSESIAALYERLRAPVAPTTSARDGSVAVPPERAS